MQHVEGQYRILEMGIWICEGLQAWHAGKWTNPLKQKELK